MKERTYLYLSVFLNLVMFIGLFLTVSGIAFTILEKNTRQAVGNFLVFGVERPEGVLTPESVEEEKTIEYMRGMYDVCVTFGINFFGESPPNVQTMCNAFVSENGETWYQEKSDGFLGGK